MDAAYQPHLLALGEYLEALPSSLVSRNPPYNKKGLTPDTTG